MKNLRKDKGITLIALIITIIILLILAGVTISLTLGDNGLFKTAQQAAKNYIDAENKEKEDLYNFDNTIKNIIGGNKQTNPTLASRIQPSDYGKSINYSVTVNGTTLNDWKVFYNDGTDVYIILSDYLNVSLIPSSTGMLTDGTYKAGWSTDSISTNTEAVATLTNTSYWSAFAGGHGGNTATGSPTADMLMKSYNAKHNKTWTYGDGPLDTYDRLYIPDDDFGSEVCGYWLASTVNGYPSNLWTAQPNVYVIGINFDLINYSVRPVVCLTSGITGTVGDTVTID